MPDASPVPQTEPAVTPAASSRRFGQVSEGERISKLYEYEILDSERNRGFEDAIATLCELTSAPYAKIAFIDRDRIWFKSAKGINVSQAPREGSPEMYALSRGEEFTAVPNIGEVKQIWNSAFIAAHPDITSLAMAPIVVQEKFIIGYVTILDTKVRAFDKNCSEVLARISRQISANLEDTHQREALLQEVHKQEGDMLTKLAVDRIIRILQNKIENQEQLKETLHMFVQGILNEFGWWAGQVWIARKQELASSQWLLSTATPPNLMALAHMSPAANQKFPDVKRTREESDLYFKAIQEVMWHPHRDILERQGVRGLVQADIWQKQELQARLIFVIPKISAFNPLIQDSISRLMRLLPPIFQRVKTNEELNFRASHDELTGLLNRRGLDATLPSQAIANPIQSERNVFFLDLDRFKEINDSYGHAVGDELLTEIATRIKESCRPVDVVARLGGDEFLVIGEGYENALSVASSASRLLETISQKFTTQDGIKLSPKISIGISKWRAGTSLSDAIQAADFQMYQAKSQGGASYSVEEFASSNAPTSKHIEVKSLYDVQSIETEADRRAGLIFKILLPTYSAPATMHSLAEQIGSAFERFSQTDAQQILFLDFPIVQRNNRSNISTLIASLHHYQSITNITFILHSTTLTNEATQIARELREQHNVKIAIADFGVGGNEFLLLREFKPEFVFLPDDPDPAINNFALTAASALAALFSFSWVLPASEFLESVHKQELWTASSALHIKKITTDQDSATERISNESPN